MTEPVIFGKEANIPEQGVPQQGVPQQGVSLLESSRIRAVFMDAGNTLVHVDWPEIARLARAAGHPLSVEALQVAEYAGREAVNRLVTHPEESDDRSRGPLYFGAILEAAGFPPSSRIEFTEAVRQAHARECLWRCVLPGTREALRRLSDVGYRLAIVSNADGRLASVLKQAELDDLVEFSLDSHIEGVEKPARELFDRALSRMGVHAGESLYVGDLYEIDVVGARAAGMHAVLLDPLGRDPARDVLRFPSIVHVAKELLGTGTDP